MNSPPAPLPFWSYTEDQDLPVTRSAGVWHSGMTLKIPYPEEP